MSAPLRGVPLLVSVVTSMFAPPPLREALLQRSACKHLQEMAEGNPALVAHLGGVIAAHLAAHHLDEIGLPR